MQLNSEKYSSIKIYIVLIHLKKLDAELKKSMKNNFDAVKV